jgi:hypothetical protein
MKNENTENEVAEREKGYKRRLLDSRIEKYLDEYFDEYIEDYGLVTKQHLAVYEKRATDLEERLSNLTSYTRDVDAAVTDLERRVTAVEKVAPKPATQIASQKQGK